jgi:hypothetical protein
MPDQKSEANIRIAPAMECRCFVAGPVVGVEFLFKEN